MILPMRLLTVRTSCRAECQQPVRQGLFPVSGGFNRARIAMGTPCFFSLLDSG
jgi:hypothetical protein